MTPGLCHVPRITISVTLRLCHLAHVRWVSHCRDLVQLPVAA